MWYLLVAIVAGQPKLSTYSTEAEACTEYLAQKDSGAHVYAVDSKKITEGECKPVQTFQKK